MVTKFLLDAGRIFLNNEISTAIGSGIMPTNNEIKDFIKVITTLEGIEREDSLFH